MLVLSRKNRESVVIGGADGFHRLLKVTVLGIKGTNVKLGFEVDADIPVHRAEVWERINGNGKAGSLTEGPAAGRLRDALSRLPNRASRGSQKTRGPGEGCESKCKNRHPVRL